MPSEAVASVLAWRDLTPMPWKNHAGSTRQLTCEPAGADLESFVWRVSVADVDADAPFSTFAGIDRTIVLLSGAGLNLLLDDGTAHSLTNTFAPFAFAGETGVHATLQGGATCDFNLMVRREAAVGTIAVHATPGQVTLSASAALAFVAQGHALLIDREGCTQRLEMGDSVRLGDGQARPDLQCAADTVLLVVHIDRK